MCFYFFLASDFCCVEPMFDSFREDMFISAAVLFSQGSLLCTDRHCFRLKTCYSSFQHSELLHLRDALINNAFLQVLNTGNRADLNLWWWFEPHKLESISLNGRQQSPRIGVTFFPWNQFWRCHHNDDLHYEMPYQLGTLLWQPGC